jgi:hypothetical protein
VYQFLIGPFPLLLKFIFLYLLWTAIINLCFVSFITQLLGPVKDIPNKPQRLISEYIPIGSEIEIDNAGNKIAALQTICRLLCVRINICML